MSCPELSPPGICLFDICDSYDCTPSDTTWMRRSRAKRHCPFGARQPGIIPSLASPWICGIEHCSSSAACSEVRIGGKSVIPAYKINFGYIDLEDGSDLQCSSERGRLHTTFNARDTPSIDPSTPSQLCHAKASLGAQCRKVFHEHTLSRCVASAHRMIKKMSHLRVNLVAWTQSTNSHKRSEMRLLAPE